MLWKIIITVSFVPFLYSAYLLCLHYKRFRHFFLRLIWLLLQPVVFISSLWSKMELLVKPPDWTITGTCLRCGQCCELIAMRLPPLMESHDWLKNMVKWYYEENFSMTFEGVVEDTWVVFSCSNLNNNVCSIYHRRPRICREYPPIDSAMKPDIEPSCGFRCIEKNKYE